MAYISLKRDNLKIYGILKSNTLQVFVATENDVKKGHNRMPLNLARLIEEDILSDEEISQSKTPSNQRDLEMTTTDKSGLQGGVFA